MRAGRGKRERGGVSGRERKISGMACRAVLASWRDMQLGCSAEEQYLDPVIVDAGGSGCSIGHQAIKRGGRRKQGSSDFLRNAELDRFSPNL